MAATTNSSPINYTPETTSQTSESSKIDLNSISPSFFIFTSLTSVLGVFYYIAWLGYNYSPATNPPEEATSIAVDLEDIAF